MTTAPSRPARPWGVLGAGLAAVWLPALAVLAVAASVGMFVVRRRRRSSACPTATAQVDLGMPAIGGRPDSRDTEPSC